MKFFSHANEFYHTAQLDIFFTWLASKTFSEPFFVLVDLPLQEEILDCHRKKTQKDGKVCGFIVCQTNALALTLTKISRARFQDDWYRIWYAEGVEIWESKSFHNDTLPLRFGLSLSEKDKLLRFARKVTEAFFEGDHDVVSEPDLASHLYAEKTQLDVGIWINGEIRGSVISPLLPLIGALRYAAQGALRDFRMKPVEQSELKNAQIEITIMSDLVLPLREKDINMERIDTFMGYYVANGKRRGWYLPTVFNCVHFLNMSDFKKSLIERKAHITKKESDIPLYSYQVSGWIEDFSHSLMLMEGPVAYEPKLSSDAFLARVKIHGDNAAKWLLNMCDDHGALPLYVDPLHQRTGRMDWGRLAHAAYGLAIYGSAIKNQRLLDVSRCIIDYVQGYIFDTRKPSVQIDIGVSVYLLHANLEFHNSEFSSLLSYVEQNYKNIAYRPIMSAVLASLFARLTLIGKGDYQTQSIALAEEVFTDFKKSQFLTDTQLALYPELIYTFQLLNLLTGKSSYLEQLEEVAVWLIDQQLSFGSFPSSINSSFVYTRGTGKIFEVLALCPNRYNVAIEKSFEWLVRMQYTSDSLYFVEPSHRERVLGGFRHDYANTKAWIDAASHFLIGAARLLDSNET